MSIDPNVALDVDNLMSPTAIENPYPLYQRLREIDPIHWNPLLGCWIVSRYADVFSIMQDRRFSSNVVSSYASHMAVPEAEKSSHILISSYFQHWMQSMDAPEHTRQRHLMHKAFTPRMLARMHTQIQQIADELFDTVQARGQMDFMADFASPLPSLVIFALLGIPANGHALIRASSEAIAAFLSIIVPQPGQIAEIGRRLKNVAAYLSPLIAEKRANPQNDLLSDLVQIEENGEHLSEQELIIICTMLLFAGHETTTNLLGNGLLALLQHPDQLQKLREEPALIEPSIDELMRYNSTVQFVARVAQEEIELGGKVISAGQRVMIFIASADRDAEHFADPDRLDVTRKLEKPISFGYGIHFCLGAALARMETELSLTTLLHRFPHLQLAIETVEWRPNFALRGLTALPLTF